MRHPSKIPALFILGLLIFFTGCGSIDNPISHTLTEADINQNDTRFLSLTYTNARGIELPFRLYVPATYTPSQPYPLILYLHNASARGYDNVLQITKSNYWGTHLWTTSDNQAQNPCFVLVPQCGLEQVWADLSSEDLSPILENVLGAIARVQTQYTIDANRLYVVGVSMGASGTWDLICKRPDLFAAAILISGGGDVDLIENIYTMPLWVFNNAVDPTIDIESTRDLIETLREAGATPRYTEFANPNRTIEEEVFREINLSRWLFAQQRIASQ